MRDCLSSVTFLQKYFINYLESLSKLKHGSPSWIASGDNEMYFIKQ